MKHLHALKATHCQHESKYATGPAGVNPFQMTFSRFILKEVEKEERANIRESIK